MAEAEGGLIRREMQDGVLVLSLHRPPLNALNEPLLLALADALDEAAADPAVQGVVLAADGAHFSPGADMAELGRVRGAALAKVTARMEAMTKPVVACVQGNALGAAAEIVLAAHGRVAHESARIGWPEISLGLLPVAGSTQRLPRLVGAAIALKLLVEGTPVRAVEALAMGLVDAVTDARPLPRAVALVRELAALPLVSPSDRREGLRDPVAYQSALAEARKAQDGWRLPAPAALTDCIEAAQLLPFDMGLAFEQARAEAMAATDEAAGLRHVFLAERRAVVPPADLAATAPPALASIAVLGTTGPVPEVVRMALAVGLRVQLVAEDRAALTEALTKVAARQEELVAQGRLNATAREADWARLVGSLAGDVASPVDLVLAGPEAPRPSELPGPLVGLGGNGPVVLHPPAVAGGLAQLAIAAGAPLALQAAALAFGRRLGWKVLVQGPGAAIDQRLRQALSRAIAALEEQGRADRTGIAAALAAFGLGSGTRPRLPPAPAGGGEILAFCLAALMNEAARIVSESVARRPSDVDAAAVLSGLFPRWEGGPMFQADRIGAMALRANLRQRAERHPALFSPAGVYDLLLADGQTFADLNR